MTNFVNVDNEKLHKEIERRGLKITQMSREMGYGKSTLGEAARSGKMKYTQALLLERLYNIKPEEYAPTAESSGGGRKFPRPMQTNYTRRFMQQFITP